MALDDLAAQGQADAAAFVAAARLEPGKHLEQPPGLAFGDADALVAHLGPQPACANLSRHLDHGRIARRMVFQRVADQVLEQAGQFVVAGNQLGPFPGHGDGALGRGPFRAEEGQRLVQRPAAGDARHRRAFAPDTRIIEQGQDHLVHALGAFQGVVQALPGVLVEPAFQRLAEQLQIAADHAQGLAQVVGHRVGELLQLGVGAPDLVRRRALGADIFDDRPDARGAVPALHQHAVQPQGHAPPVLALVFLFVRAIAPGAPQGFELLGFLRGVFRRGEPPIVDDLEFFFRVAADVAERRVEVEELAVHVGEGDAQRRQLVELAELLLAELEFRLGAVAPGLVLGGRVHWRGGRRSSQSRAGAGRPWK